MDENAPSSQSRRISRERVAEYLRTACEYLKERGGTARKREVISALRTRLRLSEDELSLNTSGYERWHVALAFEFIGFSKAGYLKRGGGVWRLLDEGRAAMASLSAIEMLDTARERYDQWNEDRAIEEDTDDPDDRIEDGGPLWLIGTGPSGELWPQFKQRGEARIGFTYDGKQVGNLGEMSEAAIDERVRELSGRNNPFNDKLACRQFAHQAAEGDLIVARAGKQRVLGVGRITGPYRFDPNAADHPHSRSVHWIWTGERALPERINLPTKTLTEMSPWGQIIEVALGRRTQAAVDYLGSHDHDRDSIARYFDANPPLPTDLDTPTETLPPPTTASLFSEVFRGTFPGARDLDGMVAELDRKKALILQGPPGTGKTYIASQLAAHFAGHSSRVTRVQFHPAFGYEDFVRGIRPSTEHFEVVDGPLLIAARRAIEERGHRHVLLIDELNRANVARVLGEALSLLEADKRHQEHAVRLSLAGRPFPGSDPHFVWLPENLYIIATMNTADRSIALVDHALRRRFSFIDLTPAFEDQAFVSSLVSRFASPSDDRQDQDSVERFAKRIAETMIRINDRIKASKALGEGHRLGHSYFCGESADGDIKAWARRIFEREIAPQLREYCADDPRLGGELLELASGFDR